MAEPPSQPAAASPGTARPAGVPERLSVLDASLLRLEGPETPLVTGGLGVFEPGLTFADVAEVLRARIDRVPLARKRLQAVPFGGRPVWVDDTEFDLSFHLRHAALPPPGDAHQLGELLSRIISRALDQRRPLWELYMIEGLEGGRTGLFRKVHLAVAGSVSTDLFAAMLDEQPDGPVVPAEPEPRWRPAPPPSPGQLALDDLRERVATLVDAGNAVRHVAAAPRRFAGVFTAAAGTAASVVSRVVRTAPASPLNMRLTPHRRFAMVHADLEAFRRVRRAFGGAVNDAVVAVIGDAVGRLLRSRGHETKDLDLRVMVPVRVAPGTPGQAALEPNVLSDGVVGVLAPLPVMALDPVARLYRVMGELAGIRESRQAVAANELVRLAGYAPPNLHALAARLASAEQRYNLALSNAPGPQSTRYLGGVEMVAAYPFIPLAGDAALSIAVTSYAGGVFFGLLGDRAGMADIDALADGVTAAIADLSERAATAEPAEAGS
jgi:diacylglycerol O-acyltransferase / wax synthase